jgi:hypothetical protein
VVNIGLAVGRQLTNLGQHTAIGAFEVESEKLGRCRRDIHMPNCRQRHIFFTLRPNAMKPGLSWISTLFVAHRGGHAIAHKHLIEPLSAGWIPILERSIPQPWV